MFLFFNGFHFYPWQEMSLGTCEQKSSFTIQLQNYRDFLSLSCLSTHFIPPPQKKSYPSEDFSLKNYGQKLLQDDIFSPVDHRASHLVGSFDFLEQCLLVNNLHLFPLDGILCSAQLTLPRKTTEPLSPTKG